MSFYGDDISVVVPQTMLFDPNAAMQKFRLVTVLRDAVQAGKVSFVEVHEPRVVADEEESNCENPECKDPSCEVKDCEVTGEEEE